MTLVVVPEFAHGLGKELVHPKPEVSLFCTKYCKGKELKGMSLHEFVKVTITSFQKD